MTDRDLEQRLRAWFDDKAAAGESPPLDLRQTVEAIPRTTPAPLRRLTRRQGVTLLAAASFILVAGAFAAGSGLVRFTSVIPPVPSSALLSTVGPSPSAATAERRPGNVIAFVRRVKEVRPCDEQASDCMTARLWMVRSDGVAAHELFPAGVGTQAVSAWSPDGSQFLYQEGLKLYLTDMNGAMPRPIETGCVDPCLLDHQVAFSADGGSIVFVRHSKDDQGYPGPVAIVTMDLASGRLTVLTATSPAGGTHPGWSPDGRQIVFSREGEGSDGGPIPPTKAALFVIHVDGEGLRQITPPTLAAQNGAWSPDGSSIVFVSTDGERRDIYSIRPDGSGVRRLTSDGTSSTPSWTADGRILFARATGGSVAGWWTMESDGTGAALLITSDQLGVAGADLESTNPAWQPIGGPAIAPLPWTPAPAIAVGPPAPTPAPTPTPALAPGFSWTGSPGDTGDGSLGETATLLADGRVLVTGGCATGAALYDPSTGSFSATAPMTAIRAGKTATRLQDGRVLFTGGYNCAKAGEDGVWATAEIYDPATGTFARTGSMGTPREFHTATLLPDGRVLVAGGWSAAIPGSAATVTLASYRTIETSAGVLATAELYDPVTGTFTKTGSMTTFRDHHSATLLQDGRVLVAGGGGEGYASSTSVDVYDPATGRFSKTGSMKTGRWLHTATLLGDGRVLIAGGRSPKDSVHTSAEMYDPRSGRFTSAGALGEGRQQHTATLLPDGRVFIAGGYWSDGGKWRVLSSTEMYDPRTGNFSPIGSMGATRMDHTATLLHDGRVVVIGGSEIGQQGGVGVTSAVLYEP